MDRSSFPRYLVGSSEAPTSEGEAAGHVARQGASGERAVLWQPGPGVLSYQESSKWTQGALRMGPRSPQPRATQGPQLQAHFT